jgi:hypothetical protein
MSSSDSDLTQPRIFVLHENAPWVEPLRRELTAIDAPFSEQFRDRGLGVGAELPDQAERAGGARAARSGRGSARAGRCRVAAQRSPQVVNIEAGKLGGILRASIIQRFPVPDQVLRRCPVPAAPERLHHGALEMYGNPGPAAARYR